MGNERRPCDICNRAAELFLDKRASPYATKTFMGKAGGNISRLSNLAGNFPSVQQEPMSYQGEHKRRTVKILEIADGVVSPIPGKSRGEDTVISSSKYWIAPKLIVAKSD